MVPILKEGKRRRRGAAAAGLLNIPAFLLPSFLSFFPAQVVVVPILKKGSDEEAVLAAAAGLEGALRGAGVRVLLDAGREKTPGWKFSYHEMRGVPLRVEVSVTSGWGGGKGVRGGSATMRCGGCR